MPGFFIQALLVAMCKMMLRQERESWSIGLHAAYAAAHDAWMKNTSTGGYLMKMKIFFDKVRTSNHYPFHKLRLRFWWHRSPYLLGAWSKWSIILSPNQSRILLEAQTYFSDQFHFSGQCESSETIQTELLQATTILLREQSAALQD